MFEKVDAMMFEPGTPFVFIGLGLCLLCQPPFTRWWVEHSRAVAADPNRYFMRRYFARLAVARGPSSIRSSIEAGRLAVAAGVVSALLQLST